MSFGFGIGDIIAVSTLARSVWGRFRDSSDQFNAIQTEVAGLYLALDDIANNLSGLQATNKQAKDLKKLMKGCRDVLDDTDQFVRKNESLGTESSGLGSKTQKAWRKLKWDPATVNELRDRMVSNATYLNAFNTSLASQVSRATNDKVHGIAEDVQILRSNQSQQKREAVLQWLSPLNFAPQQSDLSDRRQEGTGSWLLESQEFQEWVSKEGKTLVCQGMPGAGKTMLASLVIDHLQQVSGEVTVAIVYIYCDYKRQDEQTPISLTASVTKQILQYQDSIPDDILKTYEHHRSRGTRPSFQEVLEMTGSSMARLSRLYLIVDALDELGNAGEVRQTLIGGLRPLQDLHHFSLMVTSRYIPSLALDFHQPLCMDIRASPEDIRRYVDGHISHLPNCVRKDPGLQKTIASAIVDAVEGMFLLAQLHMDSLRDKTSSKLIKKALDVLPKGSDALDLAYHSAIQRVEDQMEGFRLLAKQLLGWLTFSERLMTVKEVQHALAIEPGTSDFDEDNLGDVDEIVGFCAGLVIVDEETQIIRLVHYTTQEYFRWNSDRILPSAQQEIAISCLTYLLYDEFGDGWVNEAEQDENSEEDRDKNETRNEDKEKNSRTRRRIRRLREKLPGWQSRRCVKARLQKYPFLKYAAMYWANHVRVCGQRNIKGLIMSFAKDDLRVSSASQVKLALHDKGIVLQEIDETGSRSPFSAMHVFAYFSYEETILELLRHGFEADAEDSTHRTPLWWAAFLGHEAVVELLLSQSHVNVNNRGFVYNRYYDQIPIGTPLGMAAKLGKDKIVKLLIQREDVDVNLSDGYGDSPLATAVKQGHGAIVELLLTRRDIEADSKDNSGRTPLSLAAFLGREDIFKQLLKHKNFQANSVDADGRTPLTTAVHNGLHEGIVETLKGRFDIDVNAQDKWGRTPLLNAVKLGREAMVKLLLSCTDVKVNLKDNDGVTVLYLAAHFRRPSIMRLLTSRTDLDVNYVNSKDVYGQTPLYKAAQSGNASSVELLLGLSGIDVNPEDEDGFTPLHGAVQRDDLSIVIGEGEDSFEEAKQGYEASVTMLLGHVGIEVNPKDHKGITPLAQAVISQHVAAVKLLCAHPDVDLDPRDNAGRNVLALVKEEQRPLWIKDDEDEQEQCLEIIRTAIETRSRNKPQNPETTSS